ncbi:hypothetical protein TCAL_08013 [Tigriopus californicus]|uniref:FHA domain-containing protein n=1 Tax=Tigriopus californicus TaxID=6832 RepID=A0A553PIE4_TIGCA|nr:kanadaptin-like [Tigriopus californicus]TRY77451.1 hypothetical protein TCAL_08013 [Tigriopus californicus]|eukprot:TCALIF_08013-PA protein Name:"Similar to SLC4A1AP Kanadaptin (Homo sapiens)" AED:0.01 eAED:0.01 QI:0/-1/0/1/-1/1/1/0/731
MANVQEHHENGEKARQTDNVDHPPSLGIAHEFAKPMSVPAQTARPTLAPNQLSHSDEPVKAPPLPSEGLTSGSVPPPNPTNPPKPTPLSAHASPETPVTAKTVPRLDYEAPPWSGLAPPGYHLEVIKNGSIVSTHDLSGLGVFTMGRWTECHLTLDHPSLSRYHAVLQYRSTPDPPRYPAGFYLQDLDSTHGTYHNKKRCFPRKFYPLRVGHTVKLGGSSRLLILQGPSEDQEAESELSAHELMAQANHHKAQAQIQAQAQREPIERAEAAEKEMGVSWGMAEDAQEEPDMDHNPFALPDQTDESLYLDDPKRTLRGWFEREGHDLEYECVEQGYATFKCTVTLPLETGSVVAESVVKGKKKEAVVQCALEACRMLDRLGQLRQSHQESRAKKVIKRWEDDDFYASDEDEFLDRTGTIAKKRQVRMQMAGKGETPAVETFESLTLKHERVMEEKAKAQHELSVAVEHSKQSKTETDDLDQFMASLKSGGNQDKSTISKLKLRVTELQKEASQLEKLIEITRPTSLPALQAASHPASPSSVDSTSKPKSRFAGVLVGKRGASNKLRTIATTSSSRKPSCSSSPDVPSQVALDETDSKPSAVKEIQTNVKISSSPELSKSPGPSLQASSGGINHEPGAMQAQTISPPQKSPTRELGSLQAKVDRTAQKRKNAIGSKKTALDHGSLKRTVEKCRKDEEKVQGDYDSSDPKYATWMPPEGQSGDGRTSLNEKYGY